MVKHHHEEASSAALPEEEIPHHHHQPQHHEKNLTSSSSPSSPRGLITSSPLQSSAASNNNSNNKNDDVGARATSLSPGKKKKQADDEVKDGVFWGAGNNNKNKKTKSQSTMITEQENETTTSEPDESPIGGGENSSSTNNSPQQGQQQQQHQQQHQHQHQHQQSAVKNEEAEGVPSLVDDERGRSAATGAILRGGTGGDGDGDDDDDNDDNGVPSSPRPPLRTIRTNLSDDGTRSSCSTIPSRGNVLRDLGRMPSPRYWDKPTTIERPRSLFLKFRLACGKIVENTKVQLFIITLIVINAIMMGIGTFNFVTENPAVLNAFEVTDKVFLSIFTVEIGLQFIYRLLLLFTDGWLVFDFVIVVASWSLESLQIIRAFRIFRAFRLVTRIKPLRDLILAIGAVLPRMSAIAMLLLLIFYIFAVLFTELFGNLQLSGNYFNRLDTSLFTCMELMTLEWAEITREVMDQLSWAWLPITSFIAITGFIVFNLIVAVVCDAVAVVDRDEREEEMHLIGEQTDKEKLDGAQKRIWDLNNEVHAMRLKQQQLQLAVTMLAKEIRNFHEQKAPTPTPATQQQRASGVDEDDTDSSSIIFASHHVSLQMRDTVDQDESLPSQSQHTFDDDDDTSFDAYSYTGESLASTASSSYQQQQQHPPAPIGRSIFPPLARIDSIRLQKEGGDGSDSQLQAQLSASPLHSQPRSLSWDFDSYNDDWSVSSHQTDNASLGGQSLQKGRGRPSSSYGGRYRTPRSRRRMLGRSHNRKTEIRRSHSFDNNDEELQAYRKQQLMGPATTTTTTSTTSALGGANSADDGDFATPEKGQPPRPPRRSTSGSEFSLASIKSASSRILGIRTSTGSFEPKTEQVQQQPSHFKVQASSRTRRGGRRAWARDDTPPEQRETRRSVSFEDESATTPPESMPRRSVSFEEDLEQHAHSRQQEMYGGGNGDGGTGIPRNETNPNDLPELTAIHGKCVPQKVSADATTGLDASPETNQGPQHSPAVFILKTSARFSASPTTATASEQQLLQQGEDIPATTSADSDEEVFQDAVQRREDILDTDDDISSQDTGDNRRNDDDDNGFNDC